MKSKKTNLFKSTLATTLCCFTLATGAQAATYRWDGGIIDIAAPGDNLSAGTPGTWNTTIQNWDQGAGLAHIAWPNSLDDTAIFAGTVPAAVTVGTVSVGTISLSAGSGTTNIYSFTTGTINFPTAGAGGIINVNTTSGAIFSALLTGKLTYNATGSTGTVATSGGLGTISGNNTGLTSFELSANGNANQLFITNAGALGPASSPVKLTKGIAALSATGSPTYNAWLTTFAGGSLRLRVAGTTTYSGNGTLTANTEFGNVIASANLNYSGTLDLAGNTLTLAPNVSATIALNGAITSTTAGNLTVNAGAITGATGLGTVSLGTANPSFTGTATTTLNLGTLSLGNVDALQNATLNTGAAAGTQQVTFVAAGTNTYNIGALSGADNLDNTGNTLSIGAKAADTAFSAVITGAGGLTKVGSNSLTLSGANNYSGATMVTGGTLNVSGSLTSAITVANNARLGGEGNTTGNVVFNAGSGVVFDPNTIGANQYFRTPGNINTTAGSGTKINVNLTAPTINTNVVVFEAGTITTNGLSDFKLNTRGTLSLTSTQLLFSPTGAASLVWKGGNGTNPTFWDVNTTAQNWTLGGVDDFFLGGDNVLFNGTASNFNPVVQSALVAGTVTFDNALLNPYSLSGAGVAASSLTKTGTGKVTISNAITPSGGTTISNGTLQLGDGTNATGSVTGAITNNSALITNFGANNVTLSNDISGTGSLTQAGTGTVILTGTNSYGATTIDPGATLQVGTGGAVGTIGSGPITNNGALVVNRDNSSNITLAGAISGSGSLTKQGSGALILSSANGYTGATTVTHTTASGALIVTADGALGTNAAGTTVVSGTTLAFSGGIDYATTELVSGSGAGSAIITDAIAVGSRGFIQSVSGNNTFRGNIELTAGGSLTRIGTQTGASLTLTGTITQATGVTTAGIVFRSGDNADDFITLSNAGNSFGADSTIFNAAVSPAYAGVRLGVSNALPTNLTITGFNAANNGATLDLNGKDQTLNGLISSGGGALKIVNLNTVTPSTLTLNPTANKSSPTTILGGGGLGVINLVKNGAFTQTLSGTNSYTGNTTVNEGTLSLGIVNANNESSTVTIATTGATLNLGFSGTDTVDKLFIGGVQQAAGVFEAVGNPGSGTEITQITGTGTLTVTSNPPVAGYAPWINGFFPGETNPSIIGVTADPDKDGIANGVEMVIGGNPATVMDTALLPTIELVTNPVSTPAIPAGNYLLFTFRRSDLSVAGGVTSACQTDTDLVGPWTTAIDGTSGVVIQVDDNFTFSPPAAAPTDRVRVYVPRGANTALFGRLNALVP